MAMKRRDLLLAAFAAPLAPAALAAARMPETGIDPRGWLAAFQPVTLGEPAFEHTECGLDPEDYDEGA